MACLMWFLRLAYRLVLLGPFRSVRAENYRPISGLHHSRIWGRIRGWPNWLSSYRSAAQCSAHPTLPQAVERFLYGRKKKTAGSFQVARVVPDVPHYPHADSRARATYLSSLPPRLLPQVMATAASHRIFTTAAASAPLRLRKREQLHRCQCDLTHLVDDANCTREHHSLSVLPSHPPIMQ